MGHVDPMNTDTDSPRIVRYADLVPCFDAFIDTRTPGSDKKENFTIIGPGVSENPNQHVHIAEPHGSGEVSGHYHPKARLSRGSARPAFLLDHTRLILPAFGTYTGGLRTSDPALAGLMAPQALAILTGPTPLPCPMPR